MRNPPKAFLCHATPDKERFVEPFAKHLRASGVEVFYDEWDIRPGDRIWERISEGIDSCDTFVLVASHVSLHRPWVKEEIGGGLEAKLKDGKRFVVIVLEECQDLLPVLLRGRSYLRVPDVSDYSVALTTLVNSMHGYTERPPLGSVPSYIPKTMPPSGLDLSQADWNVLSLLCRCTEQDIWGRVSEECAHNARKSSGLGEAAFAEAVELLEERRYLKLAKSMGQTPFGNSIAHIRVATKGFEAFLTATRPEYGLEKKRTLAAVVNRGSASSDDLVKDSGCPLRVVRHLAEWIEERQLAHVSFYNGDDGRFSIISPKVSLKRMVAEWQ